MAARLGLRVPKPEINDVREELIANTEDSVIQLGRGRASCRPGKQFGSRYPGNPAETVAFDFLPDEQLRQLPNLTNFCGMLVLTSGPATPTGARPSSTGMRVFVYRRAIRRGTRPINQVEGFAEELRLRIQ